MSNILVTYDALLLDITSDVLFDIAYDALLFDICSELLLHFNEANFSLKVYKSFY